MAQTTLELIDQTENLLTKDASGMHRLIAQFPEMLSAPIESSSIPMPSGSPPKTIIFSGMGGSGIVGDILGEVIRQAGPVLSLFVKGYHLPQGIPSDSLLICVSYSGNTEETLSVYREGRERKLPCAVITSGGKLDALAVTDRVPVFRVPGGLPPRAALPHLLSAAHMALEQAHLLQNHDDVKETIALLDKKKPLFGPETSARNNPAKQIALKLIDKVVVVCGSFGITTPAALRWKGQLHENSKIPAFDFLIPEANHNAIVPFGEMKKGKYPFAFVILRDTGDSPRMMKRIDITKSIIATHVDGAMDAWSEGASPFARILSLIYLGDYVSLYLALLQGIDPTPVAPIDRLKREMGR